MKNILAGIVALGLFIAMFSSFSDIKSGSLKGMVSPANSGTRVVAMSKSDTAWGNIYQGMFEIRSLRPGTYSLTIVATPPYKNSYKYLISVVDGVTTDVGYFFLKK